jgi:hypothetical protein
MLASLPALVTFTRESGNYHSVFLGSRVGLRASIAPPGSMSSQHAVRGRYVACGSKAVSRGYSCVS